MSRIRTKTVTWRSLQKGMSVKAVRIGHVVSHATYIVESANVSTVTLLRWGNERVEYSAEEAMFEIEIPREEFESVYREKAKALMSALKIELSEYEIGNHRWENNWISYDPYEMAALCAEHDPPYRVIGICRSIPPKDKSADTGVCAEEADGTRFWCHACSFHLDMMSKLYGESLGICSCEACE